MRVRGPSNIGRAVQTEPTSLRCPSAITEQNIFWELQWLKRLTGFKLCGTTPNNRQQLSTGWANGRNIQLFRERLSKNPER